MCSATPERAFGQFKSLGYPGRSQVNITKLALVDYGPMAVSLDPTIMDFRFYKSGIYSNPLCQHVTEESLRHTVGLIGYGRENGKDYWLIKNSWGATWGDGGYMKVDMQFDCGLTIMPFYVIAESRSKTKSPPEFV